MELQGFQQLLLLCWAPPDTWKTRSRWISWICGFFWEQCLIRLEERVPSDPSGCCWRTTAAFPPSAETQNMSRSSSSFCWAHIIPSLVLFLHCLYKLYSHLLFYSKQSISFYQEVSVGLWQDVEGVFWSDPTCRHRTGARHQQQSLHWVKDN